MWTSFPPFRLIIEILHFEKPVALFTISKWFFLMGNKSISSIFFLLLALAKESIHFKIVFSSLNFCCDVLKIVLIFFWFLFLLHLSYFFLLLLASSKISFSCSSSSSIFFLLFTIIERRYEHLKIVFFILSFLVVTFAKSS